MPPSHVEKTAARKPLNKAIIKIGPADHGRRMSLEEFDEAEGEPGYLYELSRGIVTVVDVPHPDHFLLVDAIQCQLRAYKSANPGQIIAIGDGAECKLLIEKVGSERHPDVSIYKTRPPEADSSYEIWTRWVPAIVIEVVSPSSRKRDYEEKPEEYRQFGVKEYWIVDVPKRLMVVARRSRGRWTQSTIRPPAIYRTRLLPGLEFSCGAAFQAAGLG
jgi:Uma2 family endonuclease